MSAAVNSTLGYGLVLLGLACAAFSAITGIVTGLARKESALPWVRGGVYGFAAAMIGSNLTMIFALLSHDFSVKYVAQVGSKATPTIFTIVSLWSALEGSILFWGAIMGAYLFAFAFIYRREHGRYMQLSLGVMAAVATFFAFLIAGPANPWTQLPFPPADGPGPNPLLQNHPLMIIHPPMLYLGYVGMTIPFGIAAGALLRGELGDAWLVPLRKWTLVPWIFLSIGIILGGWWAYAVLGWGGYWAWDPVEDASLMPWLTATAFMHSTMVLEKKKALKLWTVALALSSFVLTILGTFMTRSGVFNSVHSFTQSDIGPTFLVFIAVLLVFCVLLLAARGHMLVAETQLGSIVSREGSILLNNLVFACITFVVLIGTLFPIITEGVFHKKLTVGEPYFNQMALPFMIAMLFLMGVGPMLPWGTSDSKTLRDTAIIPSAAGIIVVLVCVGFGYRGFLPLTTFGVSAFVTVVTLRELLLPAKQRVDATKEGWGTAIFVSASRARRRFGGYVVHLGIVIIAVAVAASSSYKTHATGTLKPGEQLQIGDYHVRFDGLDRGREPHREWVGAKVTLVTPGAEEAIATPRMNFYERSTDPVGSPSVTGRWLRDVYVSMLSYDTTSGSASFNMWVFPLVGWIWYLGIIFLALGTLIALIPEPKRVTT